jgi:hypothetical protein
MSNIIVGGWSALKAELHFATELFGRSAGPDGAIDRIKHGLGEVIAKFERLAIEEAAKVVPEAEKAAVGAVDLALQASKPAIEASLGEPGAALAEVALGVVANVGEQIAERAVDSTLAKVETSVEAPAAEVVAAPFEEAVPTSEVQ